jgi:hypothetical protein
MEIQDQNGEIHIKLTIGNRVFRLTKDGFKTFGYAWDSKPSYNENHPLDYWKAQLAFRGFSFRGSNIEALKLLFRHANTEDGCGRAAGVEIDAKGICKEGSGDPEKARSCGTRRQR